MGITPRTFKDEKKFIVVVDRKVDELWWKVMDVR